MPWVSRVMGDLSGILVNLLDRIITDQHGRKLKIIDPVSLSSAPSDFQLSRASKPFRRYFSLLVNSLVMVFLVQAFSAQLIGILEGEPLYVIGCSFVTLPCLMFLLYFHRPKLLEVRLVVPYDGGMNVHPIPEGGSIQTTMSSKMFRFLVRDDSVIDTPPSLRIWLVFILSLCIAFAIAIIEILGGDYGRVFSLVMALPMTLILFSIPVYAWWASSSSWIGLPTRLRDAEIWLIAGMAAGIPAIMVNSWLTPILVPSSWPLDFITYTISAPIGEEIFKFFAVICFVSSIKGPKSGFQVGFTVGLGFAIAENFQYLLLSYAGGGFTGLFITSLIRGIGSIPGHAVWTSFSGAALGWWLSEPQNKAKVIFLIHRLTSKSMDIIESIGIDVDMDGDKSGYDGPEYTMLQAVKDVENPIGVPNWSISKDKIDVISTSLISSPIRIWLDMPDSLDGRGNLILKNPGESTFISESKMKIIPPKSLFWGLLIAISGHSFWNGSGLIISYFGYEFGLSEGQVIITSLLWILILVIMVLLVSSLLMRGINSLSE
jgi:RsiW-degrading membrane proteinase PrsW (M82 family)